MKKKFLIIIGSLLGLIVLIAAAGAILWFGFKGTAISLLLGTPSPKYGTIVEPNVEIPMRDGVKLAADVYRPDIEGKVPVIIARLPYGKQNIVEVQEETGYFFSGQGFAYVVQDIRGKHESNGNYYPYVNEAMDGYDTIDWAAQQPWSDKNIGLWGMSYYGSTQWLTAPLQNPHLKAMVPVVTSQDIYPRWINNGVFRYNDVLVWHGENAKKVHNGNLVVDWDKAVRHLPLIEADDASYGDVSYFNDWISHPVPDPYWDKTRVDNKVDKILAPALIIEGWYDYYLDDAIDDFNRMISQGGSQAARQSGLIIGPWTHFLSNSFESVDFGKNASILTQLPTIINWYAKWLRAENNKVMEGGPIRIFVMGKNEWRQEKEWPLKRTQYTKFYLHSDGDANTENGDGSLSLDTPNEENPDQYIYNPDNPVPTIGGTTIYGNAKAGPADQKEVAAREDVLVYSTPPLEEDTEITGPIELVLYASSSALDTDFTARLVDVFPDGKAINLKDSVLRARFRKSLTEPANLEPGKIYRFEIPIGAISNLFKKGHRIRIQISSSNFPEYSRNLNTGAPIGTTKEWVKANQTVYHDTKNTSYLLLPVIPGE
jgi:uncharacterized protein